MKRVCVVLVLVSVLAGGLGAEELWGGKKNFVSGDVGLFGMGARYERLDIAPKMSVGVDVYWASAFFWLNELEAGVFGRYYPGTFTGALTGLYGELGLGFHTHTGVLSITSGAALSPGVGVKFDPGKAGDFFVEPGLIISITIGEKNHGGADTGVRHAVSDTPAPRPRSPAFRSCRSCG
jgi:hypothetical protein